MVTYLIEVHIHAFELEVRRAIVAVDKSIFAINASSWADSYTPEPSRPCSPEMICL